MLQEFWGIHPDRTQLTERDYYCRYGINNDLVLVHVQPEYADDVSAALSDQRQESDTPEKKCAFLMKNSKGTGFACTDLSNPPPGMPGIPLLSHADP